VSALKVARLGLDRGGIELRRAFTYYPDTVQALFSPIAGLILLLLLRRVQIPGTAISVGSLSLPGFIGMTFAFGGIFSMTSSISGDRDDGTLLRAKATPDGVVAYVISKIVYSSANSLAGLALLLVAGLIAFSGVTVHWVTLAWVTILGLLATIPLGIVIGSAIPSPRYTPLVLLPMTGLTVFSGLFYPITHVAGWLQAIAQAFPLYWLGLGFRAALLPSAFSSVELAGQWRLPWVFLSLALWSALGLGLAPPVLRRLARRQSGSRVAPRTQRDMLRAT
jgi:ABC-2 type transport system permease protein